MLVTPAVLVLTNGSRPDLARADQRPSDSETTVEFSRPVGPEALKLIALNSGPLLQERGQPRARRPTVTSSPPRPPVNSSDLLRRQDARGRPRSCAAPGRAASGCCALDPPGRLAGRLHGGQSRAISTAMIAITTSSSIRVNARRAVHVHGEGPGKSSCRQFAGQDPIGPTGLDLRLRFSLIEIESQHQPVRLSRGLRGNRARGRPGLLDPSVP